jgi:hypothetical protein
MEGVTVSTERLRHLMRQVQAQEFNYRICFAQDIVGPGGGVYIRANTELDAGHMAWLERRNPSSPGQELVDVVFYKGARSENSASTSVADLELEAESVDSAGASRRDRAEAAAADVTGHATEVARGAEAVYRSLASPDFSAADLRQGEMAAGLREFERRVGVFHGAVRHAIDEYLSGNTLVMDLIVKFQLGKRTVRHALNVAAFATELAVQLALKQEDPEDGLAVYLGKLSRAELMELADLDPENDREMTPEEMDELRTSVFKRELVEIFLGGFMHDCGLWNEPYCLHEGHELKGAKLIWELSELRRFAPSLLKIVLFHSDIARLADRQGVVKVVEFPDDPERTAFRREFFRTREDAQTAMEMRAGDFTASILETAELRKVMPVALAERYITQTQDITQKPHWEVINDLARHVTGGLYMRYVAALCNSQVDVIAPRRAYVKLDGWVAVTVDSRRESRRAQRLDVSDFEAASLAHEHDRNSPHLMILFVSRPDGSRARADYLGPKDSALWDRSGGLESRMYIPAGRLRNSLAIRVTGFITEEVFSKVLGEYEQEFRLRSR